MGTGLGALALGALGRTNAHAAGQGPLIDPLNPFLARAPYFAPRARSVIFLFMVGGPSHVDMFDYKPELQRLDGKPVPGSIKKAVLATRHPNVFHGCKEESMASPCKWSQHGQSGMGVSELSPHIARHVDDLCFIHSLQSESNNHAPSSYQLHTGDVRPGKASLGSWVTYGLGAENQDLPGYVMLLAAGQRASLDLIRELNLKHRDARPGVTELDARIAFHFFEPSSRPPRPPSGILPA